MNLRKPSYRKQSWFASKWFLSLVLVIFLLLAVSLAKEFYRSHQINQEIALLQEEINQLEGKNQEFSEFVEFLKTDVYLEEQARIKLGMKAPGEKVIVLKDGPINENGEVESSSGGEEGLVSKESRFTSNRTKWWNYFWAIES